MIETPLPLHHATASWDLAEMVCLSLEQLPFCTPDTVALVVLLESQHHFAHWHSTWPSQVRVQTHLHQDLEQCAHT